MFSNIQSFLEFLRASLNTPNPKSHPCSSSENVKGQADGLPTKYSNGLRVAVMLLIIFLTFSPTKPAFSGYDENVKQRKQVLGSRPPCVGKCLSCKPCMATLVIIPPHQWRGDQKISSHQEDDSYYLLSWKCRCGDKFFQP